MQGSYWSDIVRHRVTRRRALATTGAGVLGAAFLAACGSSNNNSAVSTATAPASGASGSSASSGATGATGTTGAASNGLIATPVDTTAQAKAGGTLKDYYTAELTHMDALLSNSASTVNLISVFAYPRFLKFSLVPQPALNDGSKVEGEVMSSYEVSPDNLTYTFKLRQGMLWDKRAPTNNRAITTDDVLFSWNKFSQVNASAPNIVYNAQTSPGAAVESINAPDSSTIVLKLNKPDAALLTLLAGWDQLYVMPKESDGGFDPKTTIRGHGPWILDEYVPSAHTNWSRNPDYYVKNRPFPDKLERALVPEYATRLAQFKAGNIHTDVVQFTPQDVIQLHKDAPKTQIFQAATFSAVPSPDVIFGYEGDSIFRDTRVRQALSMAIDREAFADTIENRSSFAKDGLDIAVAYNTVLSAGWGDYWLDPTNAAKFGDSVKYLQYNKDEAKKLLAAAGHANGADFDFFFNQEATYGAAYGQQVEIFQGMFSDVGFNAKLNGLPYAQWLANYHYGYNPTNYKAGKVKGFNGIGLAAERTRYTPALSLYGLMHPQGDAFHGAVPPNGQGLAIDGDPTLTDMLAKLRAETDKTSALSQTHAIIQYATQNTIFIPKPSTSKFFTVWWPAVSSNFAFNSSTVGANIWAETRLPWWIDTTKAPYA